MRDPNHKGSLSRLEVRTHVHFSGGTRPSDSGGGGGLGGAEIRGAPPLDTPLHFVSAVSKLR